MSKDFIDVYENVITPEECEKVISDFNILHTQGLSHKHSGGRNPFVKDNRISYAQALLSNFPTDDRSVIFDKLKATLRSYAEQYAEGLWGSPEADIRTAVEDIMVQKTKPSQGYHVWHCERQDLSSGSRVFSWILYLNDIEDGGETEFLYLSKRVKPKTGTLVVFPSAYTHTHRGNPPLKGDKFIMTGWNRYAN